MRRFVLVMAMLLLAGGSWAAPDLPAMMLLAGPIEPANTLGSRAPGGQDRVLAFSPADGRLLGAGAVADGQYVLIVNRTVSFNGMPLVLELQQGRRRFALLHAAGAQAGAPAVLRFLGRTLPERTELPLKVGQQTAELSAHEMAEPQAQQLSLRTDLPCTPEADVNHDGVCDEADMRILRLYGGGVSRTVGRP